jgi:Cu(I)/Ag(I) efflux system periplasmic protein CusF
VLSPEVSPKERRNKMRKFVFIAHLVLGAISLAAFMSTLLTFAMAHEGEQHEMVNDVVEKIDESAGKITLKHGPIKDLGMNESMTMVWTVKDPTILKGLNVGDKVRFQAENINGQFTVMDIGKAK